MTELILFGIVVLASATLHVGLKRGARILFDKVCDAYLFFVIVHALYALLVHFTLGDTVVSIAAPFVLGYGPFFYLGLQSLSGKFSVKDVYIHFSPLLIFTAIYIYIIGSSSWQSDNLSSVYIIQYSAVAVSLFAYAFFGAVVKPNPYETKEKRQLIKTCIFSIAAMVLLFAVLFLTGFATGSDFKSEVPGLIIYTGIFASVILAFVFRTNNVLSGYETERLNSSFTVEKSIEIKAESHSAPINNDEVVVSENPAPQKYNKSALSPAVLDDYKSKLDMLINGEKIFLDNELTLEMLAKRMRMPMHHLTQLFNVYLGENFNQYINGYRVKYACDLLLNNNESMSMEQIAFNSGFNSKVSFNRHFKNSTGVTPKEYTYRVKSTDN